MRRRGRGGHPARARDRPSRPGARRKRQDHRIALGSDVDDGRVRGAVRHLDGVAGSYWDVWPAIFRLEQSGNGSFGFAENGSARRRAIVRLLRARGLRLGCIHRPGEDCAEAIGLTIDVPVRASAVADPLTLGLPAGSPVGRDTTLDWVESCRLRDGAIVLVPIDVVALNPQELAPGYEPFTTLITNGMGAGPDLDWAVGHGLLELLQRDGNGLLFKALDRGIALDLPEPPSPAVATIGERFERAGIRAIPKFATDEFGLSNIYCVGHETEGRAPPLPIMLTGCGEACHPDRERALAKAMCEFAASRVRKAFAHGPRAFVRGVGPGDYAERFMRQAGTGVGAQEGRAFATMRDWSTRRPAEVRGWLADTVHAVRGHRAFETLPTMPAADSREAGRIARERVEASDIDVLCIDFTPPGAPVSVVKVVAPGLEVETMSYGRIGERNTRKLIERGNPADPLRHAFGHVEAGAAHAGRHRSLRRPAAVRHGAGGGDRRPALSALSRARGASCRGRRKGGGGMRLRFAYNTNGCGSHRLGEALDLMAEAGYSGVALTLDHHHLDPFAETWEHDARALRRRLDALGFGSVIETGARFLLDPRAKHEPTLVTAEPEARTRRVAFLARAVEIAAILGSEAMSFWAGVPKPGVDRHEARGWLLDGLAEIVTHAQCAGVVAALEPEPGMLIETPAEWEGAGRRRARAGARHRPLPRHTGGRPGRGGATLGSAARAPSRSRSMKRGGAPAPALRRGGHGRCRGVLDALEEVGFEKLVCVELSRESPQADRAIPQSIEWLRKCRA